jgi:hypothetical protein
MKAAPNLTPSDQPQPSPRHGAISVIGKSFLATAIVASAVAAFGLFETGSGIGNPPQATDHSSPADRQMRAEAFAMMTPLPLAVVADRDLDNALGSMNLPMAQMQQLRRSLMAASSSIPEPTAAGMPQYQVAPQRRTRLAWLTLWDTDAQDGDAVRIDSRGYSRTVTLTKQPVTFAIPIPDDGVVEVTGISDGDGGGITVGLASGESTAVFPIMSVGQRLALKVQVN